jgi:hypothetical protein
MRRFSLLLMPIVIVLGAVSCATTKEGPPDYKNISLSQVERLKIGETTKEEIKKLFGEAPMQVAFDEEHRLVWMYFLKFPGYQRLNLGFDLKSEILQTKLWFVDSRDPEDKLAKVFARYPKATFVGHTVYRGIADYFDTIKSYDDETSGLSIYLSSNKQEVETINFYRPGTIREYKDELSAPKKPKYRILVDHVSKSPIDTL